jgi:hypothetical protein
MSLTIKLLRGARKKACLFLGARRGGGAGIAGGPVSLHRTSRPISKFFSDSEIFPHRILSVTAVFAHS